MPPTPSFGYSIPWPMIEVQLTSYFGQIEASMTRRQLTQNGALLKRAAEAYDELYGHLPEIAKDGGE